MCRYRTKSECEPRSQEVCQQVICPFPLGWVWFHWTAFGKAKQYPGRKVALSEQVDYEECSLVGYTECTTEETSEYLRDDQVT